MMMAARMGEGAPLVSVIDDDDSLRSALVSLIKSVGYLAEGHESAEAFLASDGAPRTACIVTDIQMPGMSGIDLKVVLDSRNSSVPVIMITARTEQPLLDRARACDPAGLLRKPFAADALLACLDRALAADGASAR